MLAKFIPSRKIRAALAAGILATAVSYLGLEPDVTQTLQMIIASVFGLSIAGTAYEDGQAKRAGTFKPPAPPAEGGK